MSTPIDKESIEEMFDRAEKVIQQQLKSGDRQKLFEQMMYFIIANPFIAKMLIDNTAEVVEHDLKLEFLKEKFLEIENVVALQTRALEKLDSSVRYIEMVVKPTTPDIIN